MLKNSEKRRYSRHILLKDFNEESQIVLKNSKVLVIGAGGLASPLLLYLASSGIGTIGVIDFDIVELENLQRQIIHNQYTIDEKKVISAKKQILNMNSEINVITYDKKLDINDESIIKKYDIIAITVDDIKTRHIINRLALKCKKIQVSAAVLAKEGWITTFNPNIEGSPCYQCFHKNSSNTIKKAKDIGVLAPLVGVLGSMQAIEIIRELLKEEKSLVGTIRIINSFENTINSYKLKKVKNCICNA